MLYLLPHLYLANEILDRFTVRIHSRIVEKGRSWARLWYFLRGIDRQGSGFIALPAALPIELLATSSSNLRQWLREGKAAGAFRRWKIQRGILRVAVGGLFKVCESLGLSPDSKKKKVGLAPWGVTAEIGLHQILDLKSLRAAATASTAQRLQQLARFAAWRKLPAPARKLTRLPQPDDFFKGKQDSGFSNNSASGNLPRFCIHIGKRRAWTSRGFTPFGVSQNAIAQERNVSDRTVRHHLNLMGIERRQVVQSKSEYRLASDCLNHDGGGVAPSEDVILRSQDDSYYLTEKGPGGHHSTLVGTVGFTHIHSRFFSYGAKPKIWLYRTNIYKPSIKLCSVSARRNEFAKDTTTSARRGNATPCKRVKSSLEFLEESNAIPAEKDGKNP